MQDVAAATSGAGTGAEHLILRVLYQLIAILCTARVVVWIARRLGQTDVSGEILAGLVLGPSCLGAIAPSAMQAIFVPATAPIFSTLSQLGLILLMFQIGLEFDFAGSLGANKRAVIIVSAAGLVVPFALGFFTAPWFFARLLEPQPPELALGFRLFFAVAMSITAIPILGRIFIELGLSHTRTAALTIGAAAIDDVSGWLMLGAVSLIVQGSFSMSWIAVHAAGVALYFAVMMLVVRPIARSLIRSHLAKHAGRLQPSAVAVLLIALFASAAATSNLGVFAIIGGFSLGLALHQERLFVAEWKHHLAPMVTTLLLPIFFAYTGLRTDIGSLSSAHEWLLCLLVVLIAFAGKFAGAYFGARFAGEDRRSSLTVAVCMNTRALMELIVLNVGYDLGVLPRSMFTKLVLMAIATTVMAAPLIGLLMREQRVRLAPVPAHS